MQQSNLLEITLCVLICSESAFTAHPQLKDHTLGFIKGEKYEIYGNKHQIILEFSRVWYLVKTEIPL